APAHRQPQRHREHPLREAGSPGGRTGRGGLEGALRRQGGLRTMSSDYGYINARVRGMKSKLLGSTFFNSALDGTDFRSFVSTLSQSPYMRELEESQARLSGLGAIDGAVARNFYGTARSLLNFSSGKPNELIGVLLMRYDLAHAKAIPRGKHAATA